MSRLSQWFPCDCHSIFCLFQVFAVKFPGMLYHWHIPQLLFLESKLLKPTTEECQRGLTSALNCNRGTVWYVQNGRLWRGFETIFFICLKSLSHSEVSHSIKWCTGTAVPWPPHNDINPSFNLRIYFQRKTSILFCSSSREMLSLGDLKQGCSGAQRHCTGIWMGTVL